MNELETQLSKVLEKAIEIAEQTGEFAIEQAPLLLQEFYMWHIVKAIFMMLTFIAVKIMLGRAGRLFSYKNLESVPMEKKKKYALKKDGRYYYSEYSDGDSDHYDVSLFFNLGSYLSLIGFFVYAYELVYILIAPKLYLIEYFIK